MAKLRFKPAFLEETKPNFLTEISLRLHSHLNFLFDQIMLEGATLELLQNCSKCINANIAGPCILCVMKIAADSLNTSSNHSVLTKIGNKAKPLPLFVIYLSMFFVLVSQVKCKIHNCSTNIILVVSCGSLNWIQNHS